MDLSRSRGIRAGAMAAVGLWLLAHAVPAAAQLSGASSSNAGSTGNSGNADGFNGSSAQLPTNTSTTFTARYAFNVNADTGTGSTRDQSANATHTVGFTATAVGSYRVNISESFVGGLARSSDIAGCDGRADISGVGASTNIALTSGALGIGDPGSIGNGGGDSSFGFAPSANAFIDRL